MGCLYFDVFSIYAQRPLFLETTSSSSNILNDNLFLVVLVCRYIYTHGQKNKTIKFQVYPHNGWFNPHVCCLKPKFPSYPNIAIYIISCIYDIYIYNYIIYIYIEYIIVNLQFHHVAPLGPHQAIGLRHFPSRARQQLMQRRHDLRIAAALHGSRRRPRDPELQAVGHRAAAVYAAKPPGLLGGCVESRSYHGMVGFLEG